MKNLRRTEQKGIAQIFLLLGMLLVAVALPIATNLVQKSQENRSKAAGSIPCSLTSDLWNKRCNGDYVETCVYNGSSPYWVKTPSTPCTYGCTLSTNKDAKCKSAVACTGWSAVTWGSCTNGTQTGTVTKTPSGCNSGDPANKPATTRSCTAVSSSTTTTKNYYYYNGSSCVYAGAYIVTEVESKCKPLRGTCYDSQDSCNSAHNIGSKNYWYYASNGCQLTSTSYTSVTSCTSGMSTTCYGNENDCKTAHSYYYNSGSACVSAGSYKDKKTCEVAKGEGNCYLTMDGCKMATSFYYYKSGSCVLAGYYEDKDVCGTAKDSTCYRTEAECNTASNIKSKKYWFYNGSKCVVTGEVYESATRCTNDVRSTCYLTESECGTNAPKNTCCGTTSGKTLTSKDSDGHMLSMYRESGDLCTSASSIIDVANPVLNVGTSEWSWKCGAVSGVCTAGTCTATYKSATTCCGTAAGKKLSSLSSTSSTLCNDKSVIGVGLTYVSASKQWEWTCGAVTGTCVGSGCVAYKSSDNNNNNSTTSYAMALSPVSLTLAVGQTGIVTGTITPAVSATQTYSWLSSNTAVVTVTNNANVGTVTAVGNGTATITVSASPSEASTSLTVTVGSDTSALNFKIAFAGIKKNAACIGDLGNLTVQVGNKTLGVTEDVNDVEITPVANKVDSLENQVFQVTSAVTLTKFGAANTNNYVKIKGPYHLKRRMCENGQSSKVDESVTCNVDLHKTDGTVYDFSEYTLLAGDVNSDGVVNAIDFSKVKTAADPGADVGCGKDYDLNLDGIVNSIDTSLIRDGALAERDDE